MPERKECVCVLHCVSYYERLLMLIHIIYQFIAACSSVISSNFIEAHYLVQCLPFAYHLHNHCGGAGAAKIKKKKLKICQTILQCQIRQVIDANTNSNNKRDAIASKSRCSYKVPNMASTHRSVCVCGAFFHHHSLIQCFILSFLFDLLLVYSVVKAFSTNLSISVSCVSFVIYLFALVYAQIVTTTRTVH